MYVTSSSPTSEDHSFDLQRELPTGIILLFGRKMTPVLPKYKQLYLGRDRIRRYSQTIE